VEQVEPPYTPGTDTQRQLDTWGLRYPEQEDAGRVVTEPRHAVSRDRRALLIVAIVLVVAGGGLAAGIAFWPRGDHRPVSSAPISAPPNQASTSDATESGEPASSGSEPVAHDQTVAIDGLLDEMASSRTKLGGAVSDAFRCDELTAALDTLNQVRDERQEQLNKARALTVDAIDEGVELRNALIRAADYSLRADEEFLAWAEANEGCTGTNTPKDGHFDRGEQISTDQAGPAKQEFANRWNPVAEQEGLSSRSTDDF
jgi:hypothetical protein